MSKTKSAFKCARQLLSCVILVLSTFTFTVKAQNISTASSIDSLAALAHTSFDNQDPEAALGYYAKAQQLAKEYYGVDSREYDDLSYGMARSYFALGYQSKKGGDYNLAIFFYEQVLNIERQLINSDIIIKRVLLELDYCCRAVGKYDRAIDYNKELLSFLIESDPNYGRTLNNIGISYAGSGDNLNAINYYQQALVIYCNTIGENQREYADTLYNIGISEYVLCNYSLAIYYNQKAQAVYERMGWQKDEGYAKILNNLGNCYAVLADYSMALQYYHNSLAIYGVTLGKDHYEYAKALANIGNCYADLGDHDRAILSYQQALTSIETSLGKESIDYAKTLDNIGNFYIDTGDYEQAQHYYHQYFVIIKHLFGDNHPNYAKCVLNNGLYWYSLGRYSKALEFYQQALKIQEKVIGNDHSDYAISLYDIGCCYSALGDYSKALEYYQQALKIREKVLGQKHPIYTISLSNVAICYTNLGDYAKAAECFNSYSPIAGDFVTRTFSSLTESQRTSFWEEYQDFYTNRLYDYATILSPLMNSSAYDGALLGKGLLLNAETEMRKLILESGDEEALHMYNEVQQSRLRLDKMYEDPVGKKAQIDSLNNDIEARQQELMKQSKAFGDYTKNLALKWTDVQAALGKKDIAIEFETYTHKDTTFYIALTVRPGYSEPHLVELFNDKELSESNPTSAAWYTQYSSTELIWGNLSEELAGVDNVYFSPSGELNNIGIEYLKDKDETRLISEKRNFYRLTSTRELVKSRNPKKAEAAVVYGGIRYDITPKSRLTGEESETELLAKSARRMYLPKDSLTVSRGEDWDYLPGTKSEAEDIAKSIKRKKLKIELIEGADATEESFKALDGAKKDIIHIATHGFYYTEKEARKKDDLAFMLHDENRAPKEDKMMTRSGLLFAGAKNTFEGKEIPIDVEDGIVTAKDISRMDLRGADLVVLSACQSGLGEIKGDGVFGLQRGFKKAGAQTLVMSLWEVDDAATRLMMTRFYDNMLKGQSKYEAFKEAQNYLRKKYNDPYYYATFIILDAF